MFSSFTRLTFITEQSPKMTVSKVFSFSTSFPCLTLDEHLPSNFETKTCFFFSSHFCSILFIFFSCSSSRQATIQLLRQESRVKIMKIRLAGSLQGLQGDTDPLSCPIPGQPCRIRFILRAMLFTSTVYLSPR